MIEPIRIQRSRNHKQISPNGLPIKYVGRNSMWGNPFRLIGDMIYVDAAHRRNVLDKWVLFYQDGGHTIDEVVKLYEDMYMDLYSHDVEEPIRLRFGKIRDRIIDLEGCNLSCWCSLKHECHADILLKVSNLKF
jgi:hypothetical protein